MQAAGLIALTSGAVPAGSWDTFHVDRVGASLGRTATALTEPARQESYPGATLLHCAAFAQFPVRPRPRSAAPRPHSV